jgi:hypothetical protein
MTKIAIVPNAAGTGTFTIEAPNSNSNRTLVLPDAAGELLTDVSGLPAANLTGDVAAARITNALNATGSAPVYACRAWVNFDGTLSGPITPRASGNVSSVTKGGTGNYTVNFTTAMPDANYCLTGVGDQVNSNAGLLTTTSSQFVSRNAAGTLVDAAQVCVAIFR